MNKLLIGLLLVPLELLAYAFAACIYAIAVKPAWNFVMPYLFHLPTIGYKMAWGLSILSCMMFNKILNHIEVKE